MKIITYTCHNLNKLLLSKGPCPNPRFWFESHREKCHSRKMINSKWIEIQSDIVLWFRNHGSDVSTLPSILVCHISSFEMEKRNPLSWTQSQAIIGTICRIKTKRNLKPVIMHHPTKLIARQLCYSVNVSLCAWFLWLGNTEHANKMITCFSTNVSSKSSSSLL